MKKSHIFLIVLILLSDVVFSQQQINQKDAIGRKQGEWKGFYNNGSLRYKGQFKDDKEVGTFTYYYGDGKVQSTLQYLKPGYCKAVMLYSTGDTMSTGYYANKERDSVWITYGAGNRPLTKGHYNLGYKYGNWETYYPSGAILETIFYDRDLEQGKKKIYYESGQLKSEENFEQGVNTGSALYYHPNGKVSIRGLFKEDRREDVWSYYDTNGVFLRKEEYSRGKLVDDSGDTLAPLNQFKDQVKDQLEFEDLRGKIKYE